MTRKPPVMTRKRRVASRDKPATTSADLPSLSGDFHRDEPRSGDTSQDSGDLDTGSRRHGEAYVQLKPPSSQNARHRGRKSSRTASEFARSVSEPAPRSASAARKVAPPHPSPPPGKGYTSISEVLSELLPVNMSLIVIYV